MAFLKERNEKRKLEEIPPEHLNHILREFIITVKRKGGDEFESSSLRGFLCSFDRHLKAFKYPKNLIEDWPRFVYHSPGLDEKRRLTNHNVRKTVIQKPNDSNVSPTHIMQLSGHRNMLSVNYSSVSKEQQVNSGTVD